MAFKISHSASQMSPHADRSKADTIRSRGGSAFAYQFGQGQGPTKASTVGSKRSLHSQHTPKAGRDSSVEQWAFFPSSIGQVNTGPDLASLFDSPNIAWLTPPTTASLSSTPGSVNDTWDEPKTPCSSSSRALTNNFLTCFTPPTPLSHSLGSDSAAKIAVFKASDTQTIFDRVSSSENKTKLDDEEFQPKKLFRNLTQELKAISKANAPTAQTQYCLNPSSTFSFEEPKPVSSRTRSKTGNACPRQVPEDDTQQPLVPSDLEKAKFAGNKHKKLLELILPFSVQTRLRMSAYLCVASLGGDASRRCAYQSKGHGNAAGTQFERLVACKEKGRYDTMIQYIESLVQTTMCHLHQNVVLKQLKAGARIDQLQMLLVGITDVLSEDRRDIDQWLDAISNPEVSTKHVEPPSIPPTSSSCVTVSLKVAPRPMTKSNSALPKVKTSYSLKFRPFLERRTMDLSVSEALQQEIQEPLKPSDHSEGFIYIFWDKKHFGKVKIGRTNNLARRLKDWNSRCKRVHSYLSMDDRSQEDMPHVQRVETLIHTELKECREQRQCEGCGRTHIEWFRENEVHAVKVARKWQEWIMQKPYMFDEKTQLWVLKPEMIDTLEQVCQPVPRAEATPKPQSKSVGVKGALKKTVARKTM